MALPTEIKAKTRPMLVTPEWASTVLAEHNTKLEKGFLQRPYRKTTAEEYATSMKNGMWLFNPHPVVFGEDGTLIDGQHRLWAVKLSGVSVWMNVTTDCPCEQQNGLLLKTMDVIDRGRKRDIGQQLYLSHGYHNGPLKAKCANTIAYIAADGVRVALNTPKTLYILEKLNFDKSIDAIANCTINGRQRTAMVIGTLAFYHKQNPGRAIEFAQGLFRMEELKRGHPVLALIRYLQSHHQGTGLQRLATIKTICGCLRAFESNEELTEAKPIQEAFDWLQVQDKKSIRKILDLLTL